MAFIQDGRAVAGNAAVENVQKAQRIAHVARSNRNFGVAEATGTIAAALAINSTIFAMRLSPVSPVLAFIERIRIQYTTIVAYTTPVTAGRRLGVYLGTSSASPSGGTAIATVGKKDRTAPDSQFEAAQGGDARISTTGALTVTGSTFDTNAMALMSLVHVGAAGAFVEEVFEFNASESAPLILQPGNVIAIRNPQAMDAAGTWQATVRVDWHEGLALSSSVADS